MEALGTLLMIVGGIASFVGGIWVVVLAFKESIGWGLGSLLVPFVAIIYAATHWEDAKKPFLIYLGGVVVLIIGVIMGAASA